MIRICFNKFVGAEDQPQIKISGNSFTRTIKYLSIHRHQCCRKLIETNSNTDGNASLQYVQLCAPLRIRNSCGTSLFRIAICTSELPSYKKSSSPQSIYQRTALIALSGRLVTRASALCLL